MQVGVGHNRGMPVACPKAEERGGIWRTKTYLCPQQQLICSSKHLKNAEYIVLHGANPAWTASGMPINNYLQAKKAGAKFVVIGPFKNATANTLDAKWVPVCPSTDLALCMGIAYEMHKLDEQEGNVVDRGFPARLHAHRAQGRGARRRRAGGRAAKPPGRAIGDASERRLSFQTQSPRAVCRLWCCGAGAR